MNIKDLDTSKFLYDPKKPSELKRLREESPEFAELPTLEGDRVRLDQDALNRYVVLMYDKESQLRREYPKIRQRKAAAAQYAGFNLNKKREFRREVEQMLIGQIPEVNRMIVKYVLKYNDPDQLALEMYYEMYQRQVALMLQGIADPSDYKKIHEVSEKLRTSIAELSEKTLGGQDEASIIKELYADLENLRESMMPEYIADKLAKGEELGYNPYGGYEPEPLKLVQQEHRYKAGENE